MLKPAEMSLDMFKWRIVELLNAMLKNHTSVLVTLEADKFHRTIRSDNSIAITSKLTYDMRTCSTPCDILFEILNKIDETVDVEIEGHITAHLTEKLLNGSADVV